MSRIIVVAHLPELVKIVECDSTDELVNQLKQEVTVETSVRNFAILSPKLASSMASTGTDGSRVNILFEVIKELKDLKNVRSQPTRSKNVMSKSIEEVLKFLSVLAMTEVNPKNKLPAVIDFKKAHQNELKLYLKEVEKLLQQTKSTIRTKNRTTTNKRWKKRMNKAKMSSRKQRRDLEITARSPARNRVMKKIPSAAKNHPTKGTRFH